MVTAASYGYSEDWWVFYFQLFKHSNKWLEGGGGGVGLPIVVCWPIAMYEMQHTILFRMATFDTGVELLTLDGNVKRVPHLHCSSFFFNLLRLLLFYLSIIFFFTFSWLVFMRVCFIWISFALSFSFSFDLNCYCTRSYPMTDVIQLAQPVISSDNHGQWL